MHVCPCCLSSHPDLNRLKAAQTAEQVSGSSSAASPLSEPMETNKNVIIAIALSLAVILGWNWLYVRPHQQAARQQQIEAQKQAEKAAQAEQAKPGGHAEE